MKCFCVPGQCGSNQLLIGELGMNKTILAGDRSGKLIWLNRRQNLRVHFPPLGWRISYFFCKTVKFHLYLWTFSSNKVWYFVAKTQTNGNLIWVSTFVLSIDTNFVGWELFYVYLKHWVYRNKKSKKCWGIWETVPELPTLLKQEARVARFGCD